jgi:hypothetical protein
MSAIAPLLEGKRTYVGHRQKLLSRPRKTWGLRQLSDLTPVLHRPLEPGRQRTFVHRRQVGLGRGQDQAARSGLSVRVAAAEATK